MVLLASVGFMVVWSFVETKGLKRRCWMDSPQEESLLLWNEATSLARYTLAPGKIVGLLHLVLELHSFQNQNVSG